MKIGFLTSYRGQKQYKDIFNIIVDRLQKHGHEIVHSMHTTLEQISQLSYSDREAVFMRHYSELEECELIFAECSVQSIQVGFGVSYLRSKGKPIVMLYLENSMHELSPKGSTYSNIENIMACSYTPSTISEVIDEALNYMEPHTDKRFTMVFPSGLYSQLEEVTRKKKLPKAVYIRQLLEEDIKANK